MQETKVKGNLTELRCITAFMELGATVSIPFGENSRYDFIADFPGRGLFRIQCKTCRSDSFAIWFNTTGTNSNRNGCKILNYTKEDIDYFCTYYKGNCYVVKVEDSGKSTNRLFIEPNSSRLKRLSDYLIEKEFGGISKRP